MRHFLRWLTAFSFGTIMLLCTIGLSERMYNSPALSKHAATNELQKYEYDRFTYNSGLAILTSLLTLISFGLSIGVTYDD